MKTTAGIFLPFMKANIHYFDHNRVAAARQWLAEP